MSEQNSEKPGQMPPQILVRVQPTPNPNALKFVVNVGVKANGKATFSRPSEAVGIRLAEDLFALPDVRQLHFFENVVTVTYAESADVDTLRLEIIAVLQSRLPVHDPHFLVEEEKKKVDRSNLSPELQKIEEILDSTVRMFLQGDGGDIEVVSLKGHTLEVRYEGACGTCPSSTSATLDAIQGILREQFDPELEVVPL
jgi:NFU1 iron-sulfur cluster scaffold homolog, mitochondrial